METKPNACRLMFEAPPLIGGSVTHTLELAEHMNSQFKQQFLLVPEADDDTSELDKGHLFRVVRVRYPRLRTLRYLKGKRGFRWLPISPLMAFLFGLFALPCLVRLNRVHGIHLMYAHGLFVGMAVSIVGRVLRIPVIWMIHGSQHAYSDIADRAESLALWTFSWAASPKHVLVLDDGSSIPQKVCRIFGDRATVVFHALDSSKYCPRPRDDDVSANLGLPQNGFSILSAHALIPVKGVQYAVLGFHEFLKVLRPPNAFLIIAGSGLLENDLAKMTKELGIEEQVLFLGDVQNSMMPGLLSCCDVVVATSVYSNVNRSVHEAMACARPVIAFDAGRTSTIIQHMKTGLLARPADARDLADKIAALYCDRELRHVLGTNARKMVEADRSWDRRIRVETEIIWASLGKKTS